jgi:hypothetical protein
MVALVPLGLGKELKQSKAKEHPRASRTMGVRTLLSLFDSN